MLTVIKRKQESGIDFRQNRLQIKESLSGIKKGFTNDKGVGSPRR